ncbi:MAG: hypothetical protein KC652_02525 [Cyanobacteria bacterium HKST-UBA01]|nr:hypothetical protein [Cyanobacteria bacterium HKST-UBA01]
MPRRPTVDTKLSESDYIRLDQFCRLKQRTKTEVAREAIRFYLDHQENKILDERESAVEQRIKKMEDRIAKLIVKVGLDVGTLHQLFWSRADQDGRDELFTECYISAVKRLQNKLNKQEDELAEKAKKLKP